MKVTPIKTRLVHANECTTEALIAESIPTLEENTVVVISSKVVALCENRVVDIDGTDKNTLIRQEASLYTPDGFSSYGSSFTITRKTLIRAAGIDESNADNHYVLWPKDPQRSANALRAFLCEQFRVTNVGVIISDSLSVPPMRAGSIGIMLAHSGFTSLQRLAGTKDLFGREFKVAHPAIGSGLAAAANLVMGEGTEQTPIALVSDLPFVTFQPRDPSQEELDETYLSLEEDMYSPFFKLAPWQKGGGGVPSGDPLVVA